MNAPIKATHGPISMILVTMNRKAMLRQCLDSIAAQTVQPVEIIVVDNGSVDGTGEMILEMFPAVRYFRFSANLGVSAGRNLGVRVATGDYCAFLDDDAFFQRNDALERVVRHFGTDSTLGCIAFRINSPCNNEEEYKSIPRVDKQRMNRNYPCSYFCGAGFACRRKLFLQLGSFWEPLFYGVEELDFSYRVIDQGCGILHANDIAVMHCESMQGRTDARLIYHGTRNRCWVAARHLPWCNVLSHTILWWGHYFLTSLVKGAPMPFFRGVKDAVIGMPHVLQTRRCISKTSLWKLKSLAGRVYF